MTLLVTGASGFTGREMLRFLAATGDLEVVALSRSPQKPGPAGDTITWITADLTDTTILPQILARTNPDSIIHLAGLNRGSFEDLFLTNVIGTKNLLDAIVRQNPSCRVLVVSSSAVYGNAGTAPIREDCPLAPLSLYGISKAAEEHLVRMYWSVYGVKAAIARPFNLLGPGLSAEMVTGKIVCQATEVALEKRDAIDLLEVKSSRDFIDVRDVVRAYRALISHPRFGEDVAGQAFNIGSATACSVQEILTCLEEVTRKKYRVRLPAQEPLIPVPSQRADVTKIRRITGWEPRITLRESLRDMLSACPGP